MIAVLYKHKKDLIASIGRPLKYRETSLWGPEYKETGTLVAVGPSETNRRYYCQIIMENGLIKKVL